MPSATKKNELLEYKGHPLMRKENIIYYGSMSDSHIIMMQILEVRRCQGNAGCQARFCAAAADKPQRSCP